MGLGHPARARVRDPDLLVLRTELVDAPRLVEAPLLAVEVLSPYSVIRDLVDKRDEYAAAGLEHYLVARPYDTPALWYFRRDDDVLREQAYVLGHTPLTLPEPLRRGRRAAAGGAGRPPSRGRAARARRRARGRPR